MKFGKVIILIPIILLCSCVTQTSTYRTGIPRPNNREPVSTKADDSPMPTIDPYQNETERSDQEKWIELAREDLADQLNVQIEAIELVSFEFVTWEDASLDCPQPGMVYIQLPIEGYKIVLAYGGRTYPYHSDNQGNMLLCDLELSSSEKEKLNVDDGWPNQTRDEDVIIVTPRSP